MHILTSQCLSAMQHRERVVLTGLAGKAHTEHVPTEEDEKKKRKRRLSLEFNLTANANNIRCGSFEQCRGYDV